MSCRSRRRSTIACHSSRTAGRALKLIEASSQCQLIGTTWPLRTPAVQRGGVAVVARGPVALGDLVAQVGCRRSPGRSAAAAWRAGRTSSATPYIAVATTAFTPGRLRDVRLVVAAQVVDLPLVEQHDAGQGGEPRAGQRAGGAPGGLVVRVGEERRELGLRPRHQLQGRLGDDAERALVAHEQVLELVAARRLADLAPAAVADPDDLAGRQHDLEADDQVAGVPVAAADQRPAVGADPAAHQRARVRGRVVRIDEAVAAAAPR